VTWNGCKWTSLALSGHHHEILPKFHKNVFVYCISFLEKGFQFNLSLETKFLNLWGAFFLFNTNLRFELMWPCRNNMFHPWKDCIIRIFFKFSCSRFNRLLTPVSNNAAHSGKYQCCQSLYISSEGLWISSGREILTMIISRS
jgi:hypothetical protein